MFSSKIEKRILGSVDRYRKFLRLQRAKQTKKTNIKANNWSSRLCLYWFVYKITYHLISQATALAHGPLFTNRMSSTIDFPRRSFSWCTCPLLQFACIHFAVQLWICIHWWLNTFLPHLRFYSIWSNRPSTTIYFAVELFHDFQTPVSKTIETLPVKGISVVGS